MLEKKAEKVARLLVRDILNAYNRRKEKSDLKECERIAEHRIKQVIYDCGVTVKRRLDRFAEEMEDVPNE